MRGGSRLLLKHSQRQCSTRMTRDLSEYPYGYDVLARSRLFDTFPMDSQQCAQCPPPPSPPCAQPSCLIPEFTPECTDECLVLACDDPDHDAQSCLVTDGSNACDGTCTTATACNDCTGLEEIVSVSFESLFILPTPSPAPVLHRLPLLPHPTQT